MLPDRGVGVVVEDQLDGVHHQPGSRPSARRTPPRSSPRTPPRPCAPAPAGRTARTGASAGQRLAIVTLGRPGCAGHAPITTPAHGTSLRARDSSVNAVWLRVPRPGAHHHQYRRGQGDGEIAQRHAVRADVHEQTARALHQGQPARGVHRRDRVHQVAEGRAAADPRAGRRPPAPAVRGSATTVQRRHPGEPPHLGQVVVAVRRRTGPSARACTPPRPCRPAAPRMPAPPSRPSCRRRCRCR